MTTLYNSNFLYILSILYTILKTYALGQFFSIFYSRCHWLPKYDHSHARDPHPKIEKIAIGYSYV